MLLRWLISCFFSFLLLPLGAVETSGVTAIALRGHLGKEQVTAAIQDIDKAIDQGASSLVVELSSGSGDLYGVLEIAKKLYEIKESQQTKIIIFIDDQAIGPVAVLPFLADELYISLFVSWGDIPSGAEAALPTNLLRSRVHSLIPATHRHVDLLRLMGDGMVDPSLKITVDENWKLSADNGPPGARVLSPKGETLVLNQNQLRRLGVIRAVMSLSDFRREFVVGEEERQRLEERQEGTTSLAMPPETVRAQLEKFIAFDPKGDNRVGHIAITNRTHGISESTWIYVKSALDYYKEHPPKMIILELNTPGGQVFAAQKISDALYEMDNQHNIPIVAFVDNWAISAGAMLAYSCRFIAVVKDASMGAAEPIIAGQTGTQEASEKINSALRTDFGNRAKFFERNPLIAQAMVDKDMVLVLRYGSVVKLTSDDEIRKQGRFTDKVITTKGKLLTLNGEELIEYGVADLLVPQELLEPLTAKEKSRGQWPTSKSLLFQHEYFKELPAGTIESYKLDWRGQFFAILTHPAVASLLFLGLMIGFYIEISTPGFGVPGSIAVICLVLMILSSFALEAAGWLELILILLGAALLAVDVLFIPTFGLLGVTGIVFLIGGFFGLLLPGLDKISYDFDSQTFNAAGQVVVERLAWLCGALIVGAIAIAILGRYVMPRLMVFSKLMLKGEERASEGYVAGLTPEEFPAVGDVGMAETTLRPAGKVMIEGSLYDAVSVGTFIEKGTEIVVVNIEGNRIIVDVNKWSEGKG